MIKINDARPIKQTWNRSTQGMLLFEFKVYLVNALQITIYIKACIQINIHTLIMPVCTVDRYAIFSSRNEQQLQSWKIKKTVSEWPVYRPCKRLIRGASPARLTRNTAYFFFRSRQCNFEWTTPGRTNHGKASILLKNWAEWQVTWVKQTFATQRKITDAKTQ